VNPVPATPSARGSVSDRRFAITGIIASLLIAGFGFLPIANVIPGGRSAGWYAPALSDWINGSLIAIGVGLVYAIATRRYPRLWPEGSLRRLNAWYEASDWGFPLAMASAAFVVYVVVAIAVFDGRPLLIDEIVQLLQARIFGEGHLARLASPYPEFFSTLHVIDGGGRFYSQFPLGGPAMYVPGWLLGAPWLTNPLCGAMSVAVCARWVRMIEHRATVALGATVLFALAPFTVFMSASHMNHVPALLWTVIAMLALAMILASPHARPGCAFASGFALGCAGTIRPVDALAFALPTGCWLLLRAVRTRRLSELAAAAAGMALPLAILLWVNAQTTGSPLLFGYELLWGASHGLGFHTAPWGLSHTPARGLELVNLYFLRLQGYLFETPVPSLVPVVGSLALTRRLSSWDRYLLTSGALLVVLYFAYWHDGFYLGPRFLFPLLPALALFSARLPALVRERWGSALAYRTLWGSVVVSVVLALGVSIPIRVRQYSNGLLTMRWDADAAARRAGVVNAVVLVRESWGSQLVARLWARGITRSDSERFYRRIDSCQLDAGITQVEQQDMRADEAFAVLAPMLRDSALVQASPFSPDSTEGFRRGVNYTPRCLARIAEDQAGFTVMAPLLLARQPNVLYIRDLHERDSLILGRYPERDVFLLRPRGPAEGAPPAFERLARDSLYRVWRIGSDVQPAFSPSY